MFKMFNFGGKKIEEILLPKVNPETVKGKTQEEIEAARERLQAGVFGLTPEDVKKVMDKAISEKKDPMKALREASAPFEEATRKLRDAQAEEAISGLEKHIDRENQPRL
ncbi:MAG: hypothetical protein NTW60_01175 [Candidatus Wolfebacteria bacterium]|nr:hypothetical protein [Candidatus Wolfebacteria bacterium]